MKHVLLVVAHDASGEAGRVNTTSVHSLPAEEKGRCGVAVTHGRPCAPTNKRTCLVAHGIGAAGFPVDTIAYCSILFVFGNNCLIVD